MKKTVLIALFGAGFVAASYGQGLVNFNNYYGGSTQSTGISYGNGPAQGLFVGPEISVELLYGNSTDTLISQLTALPASIIAAGLGYVAGPSTIDTGAGWFDAGAITVPGIAGGSQPGQTYAFALEAFGNYAGGPGGNGSYIGYSGIGYITTQATGSSPIGYLPDSVRQASFTVNEVISVPEPSSLALAGLGGFGMLMAFRRKQA